MVNLAHSPSELARYVETDPAGDFPVLKVDDLAVPEGVSVILKLDVEGAELAAIRGAMQTLSRAVDFGVVFEAQWDQAKRVGIEPNEIIEELQRIRPIRCFVLEQPDVQLTISRPFFDQIEDPRACGYNVVCRPHSG